MKKTITALVFALAALLPFCGCAKDEASNTKTGGTAMNNTGTFACQPQECGEID